MVLFVYYEAYRWMPLGTWNGEFIRPVHNRWLYVDIVIGLLLLWMTRSFYKRRIVSMWGERCLVGLLVGNAPEDMVDSLRKGNEAPNSRPLPVL